MEFEDLEAQIDFQTRRVAAAHGVKEWERKEPEFEDELPIFSGYAEGNIRIAWSWVDLPVSVETLSIDSYSALFWRSEGDGHWRADLGDELSPELLARSYYRLGMDESILNQIDYPLTAHEKLELRLSMPREFWPKTWLDEEAQEVSK